MGTEAESHWYSSMLQGVTSFYVPSLDESACYFNRSTLAVSGVFYFCTIMFVIQRLVPQALQSTLYTTLVLFAPFWTGISPFSTSVVAALLYLIVWTFCVLMLHLKFRWTKEAFLSMGHNPSNREFNKVIEWFDNTCTKIQIIVPLFFLTFEVWRTWM